MSASQPIGPVSSNATAAETVRDLSSASKLKKTNAPEKFEAFVLQTFIEEMLPKSADSVFGGGLAGDYWRSMLAEQIAGQVAERGGIGVANMLRGGDRPGLKNSFSSIPAPVEASGLAAGAGAADILASGPPVSLSDILGD